MVSHRNVLLESIMTITFMSSQTVADVYAHDVVSTSECFREAPHGVLGILGVGITADNVKARRFSFLYAHLEELLGFRTGVWAEDCLSIRIVGSELSEATTDYGFALGCHFDPSP